MSGTPPNDVNAERALLGAVLLEPSTLDELGGLLLADDFYAPSNATVWAAFEALSAKGQPIDHVNLRGYLAERGEVGRAGGEEALLKLGEPSLGIIHPEKHAERLSVLAQRRRVLEACQRGMVSGYDTTIDHAEYIDATEASVFNAAQSLRSRCSLMQVGQVVPEVVRECSDATKAGGVSGLTTGIPGIDRSLTGMHPGDLIIIGGRPGMGKSGLAQGFSLHSAGKKDEPAAYFSMEMRSQAVVRRLVCQQGRVSISAARGGKMNEQEWRDFGAASHAVSKMPIFIDDTPAITPGQLRSAARRVKAQRGLSLVVVDYIQLMRGEGKSRDEVIGGISRALKEIAKELEVPIVALASLNRKADERQDKRPSTTDLRESGSLESDADVIAFIHRRSLYDKTAPDSEAEFIITKQREGALDTIPLYFDGKCARFDQGSYGGYGDGEA